MMKTGIFDMKTNNDSLARDKALGLLWGLVVGDCLGSPIQFMGKDNHQEITEMEPCEIFETRLSRR